MKTMYIRYDGWSPSVLGDAVSGQVNTLRCSFAFSTDWDAYKNRKAIFETDDAKKEESLDENGVCRIPRAVLMKRGKLKISAYGTETGENGELLRYNGRPAEIIVDLGGNVDGEITDDPVYPQIGEAVLYTAQSLTDAQQAQARANIGAGTPYTLPEASSDAPGGVKADAAEETDTQPVRIGEDGKLYTAPGVQETFTVNISKGSDGNITADKTFAEIKEANDAGMLIFAVYESKIYSRAGYVPDGIASFERNSGSSYMGFTCESFEGEDYWNYYEESLESLGIFGATAGQIPVISDVDEYGYPTRWASANMPSGGGADISLGISGATAGQMAKIKTVNESGAPTAWEAGDDALPLLYHGKVSEEISGFEITGVDGIPFSLSEVKVRAVFKASTASWCGIELCTSAKNPNNVLITSEGGSVYTKAEKYYLVAAHGKISNGNFEINAVQPTQFTPYLYTSSVIKNVASIKTIPNFVYNNPPVLQEMNAENGKINKVKIFGNFSDSEVIIWGR